MLRQCGSCSLCCKLIPVEELGKIAGEKCKYQKWNPKGCCSVYRTADFPPSCQLWSCLWLAAPQHTAGLSRPDRAGYVIDISPDFVGVEVEGKPTQIQVIQIWVDPKHPEAWRDEALLTFLNEQGKKGICGLLRFDYITGQFIAPPSWTGRDWYFGPLQKATVSTPMKEMLRKLSNEKRVQEGKNEQASVLTEDRGQAAGPTP